jgi:hypothetical protein
MTTTSPAPEFFESVNDQPEPKLPVASKRKSRPSDTVIARCRACLKEFPIQKSGFDIVLRDRSSSDPPDVLGFLCGRQCATTYLVRDFSVTQVAIPVQFDERNRVDDDEAEGE